jgi:CTP synthase
MGATMRLGSCESIVLAGTKAADLYHHKDRIHERHRHRYELNSDYQERLEKAGMVISAVSAQDGLVEIIEVPGHPFFIGSQFHPEFQSKPNFPHPLFAGFVAAALEHA